MPSKSPNPAITVWGMIGLAAFLLLVVGFFAFQNVSAGFFRFSHPGGQLPVVFIFIAILVGVFCVGCFQHRSNRRK